MIQRIKKIKIIRLTAKKIMFVKKKIVQYTMLINIIIKNTLYKNKIYIIGTPIHENLGDQAIIYSENQFFNYFYPDKKVIEIESSLAQDKIKVLKKIIKEKMIFIHGGGFLGSIWLNEEQMFRKIVQNFSKNTIIVMPQTIFFDNSPEGKKELLISQEIYQSHEKLYFCCREQYSYDFMKKSFPKCKSILVPDIVLFNNFFNFKSVRKDSLFCIRSDREKINHSFNELEKLLKSKNILFSYTDTVIKKNIYRFNRKKEILKKLKQISNYKILITDRLHGMVFAFLTKTPCIVFENNNYKVKGLFKWIYDCEYIKMYNAKTLEKDIEELLKIKPVYDNKQLIKKFELLKNLIDNNGD